MPLTAQDVAEITRLLEESEFDELHLEQDGLKLTLKRSVASAAAAVSPAQAAPPAVAASDSGAASPVHESGRESPPSSAQSVVDVTAPLVGIFYRAPRPGAAPYVEIGSAVEEDTIIGIIEVMKLMNAVRAEVKGTVTEIVVQDGAAVEYGEVLLLIRPGAPGG
ncbi:MAG TPA: acetyl-CoA carboxylase biotin carboxyl carrier protein [Steroidobacteraceae bacterium]|nr:acetyl-CoA carboxylase biotin carboxyl carrier protein [Steroidobacteraceae bacterium]